MKHCAIFWRWSNLNEDCGMKRLLLAYRLLQEVAMSRPWDRLPYVLARRKKGTSIPNNYPCKKAAVTLEWTDRKCDEIAGQLEHRLENILDDSIKCSECGLRFKYDGEKKCILCR